MRDWLRIGASLLAGVVLETRVQTPPDVGQFCQRPEGSAAELVEIVVEVIVELCELAFCLGYAQLDLAEHPMVVEDEAHILSSFFKPVSDPHQLHVLALAHTQYLPI